MLEISALYIKNKLKVYIKCIRILSNYKMPKVI